MTLSEFCRSLGIAPSKRAGIMTIAYMDAFAYTRESHQDFLIYASATVGL